MERQAHLALTAAETARRIYASLPLRIRFARMMIAMDPGGGQLISKLAYAWFLVLGVKGMPEVPEGTSFAKAIEQQKAKAKSANINALVGIMPQAWALSERNRFAKALNGVIWKKARKPQDADDAMSAAMEKLFSGTKAITKINPDLGLAKCESLVIRITKNALIDLARGGDLDDPMTDSLTDDGPDSPGGQKDIADPAPHFDDADLVGDQFDEDDVKELLDDPDLIEDLKKVNEDALVFVKLMLDGHDQKKILGNPPKGIPSMLPHWKAGPGAWASTAERNKTTKIRSILNSYLTDTMDIDDEGAEIRKVKPKPAPKKPAAPKKPGKAYPNETQIRKWDDTGLEPYGDGALTPHGDVGYVRLRGPMEATYETYASVPRNQILTGRSEVVLRGLPSGSIDAIVCDPPYGLGTKEPTIENIIAYLKGEEALDTKGDFMGRDWQLPSVECWRECFRVLKPGGHLLAFAGTRTWDLMALGIRAAGFESRDTIASATGGTLLAWCQGQGFPKSRDPLKSEIIPKIEEQLRAQGVEGDIQWRK